MITLDFYFDCSSPWTYLAFTRVQPLARETGVAIRWKPILVGGIFNTVNDSVYRSRENPVPAKAAYMRKDLRDWARELALEIRWPPTVFPVNSVKAMRGCFVADERGRLPAFARAVFEAYWGRDQDISRDAVLAPLVRGAGLDADDFFARIGAPEYKAKLRAATDELVARGGFGTPTMFLGDDMYFGNDRLPLLRSAIERAKSAGA